MVIKLPKIELFSYFIIWTSSIIYSMYNVYIDGNYLAMNPIESEDFYYGWSFINRKKDVSDYEWAAWTSHLYKSIPWFVFQLLFAEFTRWFCVKVVPICYVMVTFSFFWCTYPPSTTIFFMISFFIFFCVAVLKSKVLIWTSALILLALVNVSSTYLSSGSESYSYMMNHVSVCWFTIRCIDFSISELHTNRNKRQKFINMAAYVFYFPCFHLGPFIPYDDFKNAIYLPFQAWTHSRTGAFILNILRYLGWLLVFEVASHYFYCNALHFHTLYLFSKGAWTFNGVGYCMGQFFFTKYTAIYGLMGTFATAERYNMPPPPRCIHWVYCYSDMWRHFDRGFYLFIFRCIYQPLCGDANPPWRRKLYASFISFCFVFIWHGCTLTVFYWTVFNFIGITLEVAGKLMGKLPLLKLWKSAYLNELNIRRLHGLLSAPLWIFAVISNFIFFGGHDLGLLHFRQFIFGSWQLLVGMITVAYCMCQVSMEITQWMIPKDEKPEYSTQKSNI